MGRKGVLGELLIVVVLLASVGLIVSTFVDRSDVPNISRYSLGQLRDMRDYLSRAILDWLAQGVSTEVMACNGVYPLDLSNEQYADALRPYVESAVVEAKGRQITAGDLKDIEFTDDGRLLITLENGSIVYDDANIHAEDRYDKEYLFNVRLLLALRVAQDWLRCDAGNLSENLVEAYGTQCFFGVKDPTYPGFCADKNYRISASDRNYMMSKAVTPQTLAEAADKSVDELNRYFAGEAYCKEHFVTEDTGIACRYELEQMEFEYTMSPFTSWYIVIPYDAPQLKDLGILRTGVDIGDDDYRRFMHSDTHVWALPANITTAPYDDLAMKTADISCADGGREPVHTPYEDNVPFSSPAYIDVRSGETQTTGRPILYVNTTRGAKFTMKVTCTDNRAALLGEPLQYTFRFRHGLRQSCGAKNWMIGTFDCGACLPRPAPDGDKCWTTRGGTCGGNYPLYCRDSIIWKLRHTDGENLPGATGLDVIHYMRDNRPELLSMINQSCGGVIGMEDVYPILPPKMMPTGSGLKIDPNSPCLMAFKTVCCGMFGYNETIDHTHDIGYDPGFFNQDDNVGLCLVKKTCGEEECFDKLCEPSTGECLPVMTNIRVGKVCRDGCTKCAADGNCTAAPDLVNKECGQQQGLRGNECTKYVCNQENNCMPVSNPAGKPGDVCSFHDGYQTPECAQYACKDIGGYLQCSTNPNPTTDNEPCDDGVRKYTGPGGQLCSVQRACKAGVCADVAGTSECKDPPGGGGSCPGDCDASEGCCGAVSKGCWKACG